MKVYISGKITGLDDWLYSDKFFRAYMDLENSGHVPVNPVHLTDHLPAGTPWSEYMAICLPALLECEAIYLLPDWIDSKGAQIEHFIAEKMGMKILYSQTLSL